jgi:DNA adenine methylase
LTARDRRRQWNDSQEIKRVTQAKLTQPLKWHGGKHYLAARIIALMPRHLHFVEPYAGGLSVLLEKDPLDKSKYWGEQGYEQGVSEVVNDMNRELTNFWRVLQREDCFAAFQRTVAAVPFSQVEWSESESRQMPVAEPDVEAAVAFFVRCRQSRAGKFGAFATLSRNRTRRMMNEQASAWMNAVAGLPAVAARLKRVVILNMDAVEVIRQEDGPRTLFYLDPPYLHETRVTTEDYKHEMTPEQHEQLLEAIRACEGKVLLSGYPNQLYDRVLKDWAHVDIQIDNKASAAKEKPIKTERLWMNYDPKD